MPEFLDTFCYFPFFSPSKDISEGNKSVVCRGSLFSRRQGWQLSFSLCVCLCIKESCKNYEMHVHVCTHTYTGLFSLSSGNLERGREGEEGERHNCMVSRKRVKVTTDHFHLRSEIPFPSCMFIFFSLCVHLEAQSKCTYATHDK